jgi:hypothetical protein
MTGDTYMSVLSALSWLFLAAFCTIGVCALSAALSPVCLIAGGIFFAMFFLPIALSPYLLDE